MHLLENGHLKAYEAHLIEEERSQATVEKYMRDVHRFFDWVAPDAPVSKETVIRYKGFLTGTHATASVNVMLSALNSFFAFMGWDDCRVRRLKTQRQLFLPQDKELSREEYSRLVNSARRRDPRLWLILQTVCATGIRISELSYITVEAVRQESAEVDCKGKRRRVLLPDQLCLRLQEYIRKSGIRSGSVFVTHTGQPMDRSNIWRQMKALCRAAGVPPEKVYPHNLRHLFARTFYDNRKDLAKLADVLGHSSIETTRIYVASSGSEHRQQLEELNLII